jgi:hypothetical protein
MAPVVLKDEGEQKAFVSTTLAYSVANADQEQLKALMCGIICSRRAAHGAKAVHEISTALELACMELE